MNTPSAIACHDLSKRYDDGDRRIDAVQDVSLEIPSGSFWILRGPSGSGKTTLLGLMGAMIAPTRGEVRLFGEPASRLRDHHRAQMRRAHIGFVFQELGLIPEMTLLENVLLPLVPQGGATPDDRRRACESLERFGLGARIDTKVQRLSGGERQRGAIARALITKPRVLLLDEPTAHLDLARAQDVARLLASIRKEGLTVVAATHDPRLADDPSVDRVVAMEDGRVTRGADNRI